MNIYEDEAEAADKSVLAFVKRHKQLVIMAITFLVAYGFTSLTSAQMDKIDAGYKAERAAEHQRANPWSVDK